MKPAGAQQKPTWICQSTKLNSAGTSRSPATLAVSKLDSKRAQLFLKIEFAERFGHFCKAVGERQKCKMKSVILLLLVTVTSAQYSDTVYTFYDNVGTIIAVEVPAKCEMEPAIITMWKNATMTCPEQVSSGTVGFIQPLMYFPYINVYFCDLKNNTLYYTVSNCGFKLADFGRGGQWREY